MTTVSSQSTIGYHENKESANTEVWNEEFQYRVFLTSDFTFTNDSTCSGIVIQFTADITNGTAPFTYLWNFGDGSPLSPLQNPTHTYNSLGCGFASFMARLTVTDATGATAMSVQKRITVKQIPDVQIKDQNNIFNPFNNCNNSPTPANPNYTITVGNNSPSTSCITSYSIDWGDGTTSQNNISFPISHPYTQLGAFNLVITGVGANGCSNSKTYLVANQSDPGATFGTIPGTTTNLCAPVSVPLLIDNWASNSTGTIYVIRFGDGDTIRLTHPLKPNSTTADTIYHTYTTSSCPNSAFVATLYVINACLTKPYTAVVPVQIKPSAAFKTDTVACAGQSHCFANTTIAGYSYIGSTCSSLTAYTWNFGDGTATSSVINPCHTYASVGTYTISLMANNPCGTDTFRKTICVTAPPITSFSLDTASICTSQIVTATNTSVAGTCPPTRYRWSIAYTAGSCGTNSSWAFANSTNDSSANPSFVFNNPGNYTITLRVLGPCNTPGVSKTVTVKRKPLITNLPPISNSCNPITICPMPAVSNCGDPALIYHWIFDGGALGTSDSLSPGCVTFSNIGAHSVFFTASNGCGADTIIRTFQINAGPQLTIPISNPDTVVFCPGQIAGPFNFTSIPASPPTNITWLNNNTATGLGTGSNGNINSFTAGANNTASPITGRVIVTATNNGCSTRDTFYIRVNPKPAAPLGIPTIYYCKDSAAVSLSNFITPIPGHTLLWYTTATGGVGNPNAPTPPTNATGNMMYYVSQVSIATGCESNRTQITVNIQPIPTITSTSFTNPIACNSPTGTITLNGLTANTSYTIRYNYNGSPVNTILTTNGNGTIIMQGLVAGTYTAITVTPATSGGCTSAAVGPINLQPPNSPPAPLPTGNSLLCQGDTLRLSITPPLAASTTYSWTGPGGPLGTGPNQQINNVTVVNSGMYSVIAITNGCPSLPGTLSVTVNPKPPTPVPASSPVCSGDTLLLFANNGSPSNLSYQWSGPSGFSSNLQNPVIPNASLTANGNYNLIVSNTTTGCSSAAGTVTVTIRPTPVISNFGFTNPVGCSASNGNITLSGLAPGIKYKVFYRRDSNTIQTDSLIANASGIVTISGLAAGTYTGIYVSLSNCSSNTIGPITLAFTPPFTAVASGTPALCDGEQLNLYANPASSALVSYNWQGPGFTSTLQNPIINPATILNSGVYHLTITINGCISTDSIMVTVSPRPVGGNTDSDTTVCAGTNTGVIRLRSQYGTVQRWEGSSDNGATWNGIANTTSTYTYNNLTANTWYRVAVRNGTCPIVYSDTTKVNVAQTVTSVSFTPSSFKTCNHDTTVTFNGSALYTGPGTVRYSWYINGMLVNGNTNPFTYRFRTLQSNTQPILYTIGLAAQTSLGCADTSAIGNVIVSPVPAVSIRVTPSVVQDEPNVRFSFEDISPASATRFYTWRLGDRGNQIRNGKQVTFDYEGPGIYNVVLNVTDAETACTASDSVKVTIRAVPGKLYVPDAFYPNSAVYKIRTFKPEGIGMESYRMQIFDSWGRLLFETTQLNPDGNPKEGWDGTDARTGRPMPQDIYGWQISAKFKNGKVWDGMSYKGHAPQRFGTVTIFR